MSSPCWVRWPQLLCKSVDRSVTVLLTVSVRLSWCLVPVGRHELIVAKWRLGCAASSVCLSSDCRAWSPVRPFGMYTQQNSANPDAGHPDRFDPSGNHFLLQLCCIMLGLKYLNPPPPKLTNTCKEFCSNVLFVRN